MTAVTFHDAPIASRAQDHLGRDAVAKALHTLVTRNPVADSALVIGVFGAWGSGKSSLMTSAAPPRRGGWSGACPVV